MRTQCLRKRGDDCALGCDHCCGLVTNGKQLQRGATVELCNGAPRGIHQPSGDFAARVGHGLYGQCCAVRNHAGHALKSTKLLTHEGNVNRLGPQGFCQHIKHGGVDIVELGLVVGPRAQHISNSGRLLQLLLRIDGGTHVVSAVGGLIFGCSHKVFGCSAQQTHCSGVTAFGLGSQAGELLTGVSRALRA